MIVVIKPVLAVIRDVQIRPAVVVVIADGHAKSPSLVGDARFVRHVGKRAVVIVVKKRGARRLLFSSHCIKGGTIHEINVGPAVVVVIKNCHTGAGRFEDQVFLRRAGNVLELVEP